MKKIIQLFGLLFFVSVLFFSCKDDEICLECVITIAGIEEDKGKTCDDLQTINQLESDYEEIVARENAIVGQSATLKCLKYVKP